MANRLWRWAAIALIIGASAGVFNLQPASACGGFFCQNSTIDQNSERIIFTRNRDGTISAYVQIQYTGSAPDFSWILPIPEPIGPENLAVPEDTMAAFTELEVAADQVFVSPEMPQSATELLRTWLPPQWPIAALWRSSASESGPYGFDVVGSKTLTRWLTGSATTTTG